MTAAPALMVCMLYKNHCSALALSLGIATAAANKIDNCFMVLAPFGIVLSSIYIVLTSIIIACITIYVNSAFHYFSSFFHLISR